MIDYQLFAKIRHLKEHEGLNASQIAGQLDLDPRTVRKWPEEQFRPRKVETRPSKLDPFKNDIQRMLEQYPYSAAQIFQRIGRMGFDGGYTIVKQYVRKVRPPKHRAFLKLAFAPGECARVDWGSYGSVNVGNTRRRLSFFVMVLCYSRMMYVEFTVSQTIEHFPGCRTPLTSSVPYPVRLRSLRCGLPVSSVSRWTPTVTRFPPSMPAGA